MTTAKLFCVTCIVPSRNEHTGLAVVARDVARSQTDCGTHKLLYIYEDPT
jgi:hypothetical protein